MNSHPKRMAYLYVMLRAPLKTAEYSRDIRDILGAHLNANRKLLTSVRILSSEINQIIIIIFFPRRRSCSTTQTYSHMLTGITKANQKAAHCCRPLSLTTNPTTTTQ